MDGDSGPIPDERPQRRREYSGAASTLGVAALIVLAVAAAIWWFEIRGRDPSVRFADDERFGVVELPGGLNGTGQAPASQIGRAAPDFVLATPDGAATRLSDMRGDWVLLNFWASWCEPCRSETPDLQSLAKRLDGGRFTVLGVNQQESGATAREFIADFGLTYPMGLDRDGEVSRAYRVGRGLPVTLLIDAQGVIRRIYPGRLSADQLAEIERLVTS